jgi:hypothetical protein
MARKEVSPMRPGLVKVYAHRLLSGQPILLFRDNRVNRAIESFARRIRGAMTRRPKKAA